MNKALPMLAAVFVTCLLLATVQPAMAVGRGWSGYNYEAQIFVGTGYQWCEQKFGITDPVVCEEDYLGGPYGDDKLVMKWSDAWDDARFHGGEWTCDAWTDNEWSGMFPGGSRETMHSKIIWVGPELEDSPCWVDGGYAIWGSFEVIFEHGTADGQHYWSAHGIPSGYGAPSP